MHRSSARNRNTLTVLAAFLALLAGVAPGPANAVAPATTAVLATTDSAAGAPLRLAEVTPDVGSGVTFQGRLYFAGTTAGSGRELWVTDGTVAGTHQVVDLSPGADSSSPFDLTVFDDRLYFVAATPSTGYELFSTDGTAVGTRLLRDIYPGTDSSGPGSLVVAAGALWFAAFTPTDGRELWISDGTLAHTHEVVDLRAGSTSSSPSELTSLGDRVVFRAMNSDAAFKPWVAVPGQPVRRLDALDPSVSLSPHQLTVLGSRVLFAAGQGSAHGEELWVSDGQAGDARELVDINPGPSSSLPYLLTVAGGRVWFSAIAPGTGAELWSSDGTPAGTALARDVRPGELSSSIGTLVGAGDRLYFNANDGQHGVELWTASRTGGVHLVLDALPGPASGALNGFDALGTAVGGLDVYAGIDAAGAEPWVSDGTAAGTHRIADLAAGAPDSLPYAVGVLGNTAIFWARADAGSALFAWTPPAPAPARMSSKTVARAARHYSSRQAQHRRIRIPVTVTTAVGAPLSGGTVRLVRRGRVVGSAVLVAGHARVRISTRLRPRHRYVVSAHWSGNAVATPSVSASVTVRVRR